jgi:hypothetical protein
MTDGGDDQHKKGRQPGEKQQQSGHPLKITHSKSRPTASADINVAGSSAAKGGFWTAPSNSDDN